MGQFNKLVSAHIDAHANHHAHSDGYPNRRAAHGHAHRVTNAATNGDGYHSSNGDYPVRTNINTKFVVNQSFDLLGQLFLETIRDSVMLFIGGGLMAILLNGQPDVTPVAGFDWLTVCVYAGLIVSSIGLIIDKIWPEKE